MPQGQGDGPGDRGLGRGQRLEHPTDVVGAILEQRAHEDWEIARQVNDVCIHADDHLAARRLDPDVQPARRDAPRVVEQPDHGVARRMARDDVARAVAAHTVHHEHLHPVGGIVAREDRLEAPVEVLLLVAARHDHGDEGWVRACHEVPASAARGQAWKIAAYRLKRVPSAASGHSPRRRAAAQSRETSAPTSSRA